MERHGFAVPEQRPSAFKALADRVLHHGHSHGYGAHVYAPPQPNEPGALGFELSLSAPNSSGVFDPLDDFQITGVGRSSSSNDTGLMSHRDDHRLAGWLTYDKPWDPVHGRVNPVARPGDLPSEGRSSNRASASFSCYREDYVPSECDTTGPAPLPSDSGYESLHRPRQSIVNGSISGDYDRSAETASISSHLASLQVDPSITSSGPWGQQGLVPAIEGPVKAKNSNLTCPWCKNKVKTMSEMKKHQQKHEKPYHCDVTGCTRPHGFSTPNDVERHKRSCHPEMVSTGIYYRCTVENCRNKNKKWPRADNFRQHLKRVHHKPVGEDDLEKYIYKAQTSPAPELSGLGTSVEDLMSMNPSTDGNSVLSPDDWDIFQITSEESGRRSYDFNYMDEAIDFQHAAGMSPHQLQVLSSENTPEQILDAKLQLSPGELETATTLHDDRSECHDDLPDLSDQALDVSFDGSSFLNEAAVPEDVRSRGADRSEVRDVLSDVIVHEEALPGSLQNAQSKESGHEEHDEFADRKYSTEVVEIDNDDGTRAVSTSSTEMTSSRREDGVQTPHEVRAVSPEQPKVANAIINNLDIYRDKNKVSDLLGELEAKGILAEHLEKHGYTKPKEPQAKISMANVASEYAHLCPQPKCGKTFQRQCELKKHMKRHDKPYGCTYPKCDKRFGSKNDWKRHENSQHYQLELWKCNEKSNDDVNEVCGKVCHRREQLKTHLLKDHGIDDPPTVDVKLDECRVGRNCDSRFWCGFCRRVVEVEKGSQAWHSRFDHIDGHITGRTPPKMAFTEWKGLDPDLPETDLISAPSNDTSLRERAKVPSSGPAGAGAGFGSKRGAEEEIQRSISRKKARVGMLWSCCHCHHQWTEKLHSTCLNCHGHKRCDNCETEYCNVDQ